MKTKIQINSIAGNLLFEFETENNTVAKTVTEAVKKFANLSSANLRSADLRSANLRFADLRSAKKWKETEWFRQCSRDILFILGCLKAEVPALKKMLIEGKVDGSQYEGECACLIGSLANADGGVNNVCSAIPFYEKGLHNFGEQFFWQIRKGDTPETSEFSAHALELCEIALAK